MMTDSIFLGGGGPDHKSPQNLLLARANRHGLVAGATGTGKTVTLQVMAQAFSDAGVPVFAADVKGDLSGICMPGSETHKAHASLVSRAEAIGMGELKYEAAPTIFWDVFGDTGHPIRATITEMGPLLLSRLMGLTDVQEGVLNIAFQYADDNGLLLLDLKDLRKLLVSLGDDTVRTEVSRKYGNVAPASLSAVQRELLVLERDGAERFFGEPALELSDFMRVDDERAAATSTSWTRASSSTRRSSIPPSCSGCSRSSSRNFRRSAIPRSRARLLLRRGAPAVRRRAQGPYATRSSRSCA
jgi:DNA helicase HerA-like ATPase